MKELEMCVFTRKNLRRIVDLRDIRKDDDTHSHISTPPTSSELDSGQPCVR